MALHEDVHHFHSKLGPEWIPRELKVTADLLSKVMDLNDWMLNPKGFQQVDIAWGPHTIDDFASFQNCQLPSFYSHTWKHGLGAVDALKVN